MVSAARAACTAIAVSATLMLAPAAHAQDAKADAGTLEGIRARNIGPAAMSGRVTAIDGYRADRLTLFVGAAAGGVWKSRDGGITFKPVFDKHTQSIGAITVAPKDTNTVWVGTGEPWVRNSVSVGDGVYKTTDGGENWQKMGLENSERVSRIAIDPRNSDVVFVGALGALWNDNTDRGVYRTRDGGKTWDRVLFVDAATGCADLAMDPKNPDVLYAAMWQFRRKPWSFSSGGPGSALYKSTDGGTTWKKVGGGLPSGVVGRICVAIAPSQPSRVYAAVETGNTALWRSDDGGATWKEMSSSASVGARPFYFASMQVDAKNPDRVYKQGFALAVSEDGGKTFTGGGAYHGDTHALFVDPADSDHLVLGTDGGVYVSYDRGVIWRFVGTLPISQFYHVSLDMQRPYNVYGGLQDNGSWTAPSRLAGGIGNRHWKNTGGGDGFWAFADPNDNDIVYCEYQGGTMLRFRKSTNETKAIKPFRAKDEPEYRWNWNAPIHMSPTKPGTIYFGAQFLFRSTDRGDNWTRISPDLTTNDPAKQKQELSGGVSVDNSSAENHCTVYAIAESPKNADVIWVGTDDGNVQVTRDGGKRWTNVTKAVAGVTVGSTVSYVRASPHDAGTAYISVDGHALGDMKPYVFVTRDYGASWKALATADLKGFAHVVIDDPVNPALLFVGTEFGLFASLDGGASWAQMKGNLTTAPVRDLAIHPREHDLVIATHGRGVYIVDDLTPLRGLTPAVIASDCSILGGRPAEMLIPASEQRFDGDDQYVGESSEETAWINYWLKKRHMFGDLKLEIFDDKGKLITSIPGSKRRGVNRVGWSMRARAPKVPPATNLVPQQYSFVGPRVPAGTYNVKLTRDQQVLDSKVVLVPDPRANYTAEDRAIQQKTVNDLYRGLESLTFLNDQLVAARDRARAEAKPLKSDDPLAKQLGTFADGLEEQRKLLVATREGGRLTGEEQMREKLGLQYGAVNGYDGRPTGSQLAYSTVLLGELSAAQAKFEAYTTKELAAINPMLETAKLAPIALLTREEWEKKR